jgi:hypothetical protein
MDGGGEVLEGVAALLAAGFDHGQHRCYEAAWPLTLIPRASPITTGPYLPVVSAPPAMTTLLPMPIYGAPPPARPPAARPSPTAHRRSA